jgi:hypothetical protein
MRFSANMLHQHLHADLRTVIDPSLTTWSIDNSPREVACYRLKESLTKKFNQALNPSAESCQAALKKFMAVNDRVGQWELAFDFDWDEELFNEFKLELNKFWYRNGTDPLASDFNELFVLGRTGPGASKGAKGDDIYTKLFGSNLTATRGLADIWRLCVRQNPLFREAYSDPAAVYETRDVDCNNLSFVNKTEAIARSICTEPTINMWFQLGMGKRIEQRLAERYGIDLGFQPEINRRLATIGSMSDQLVTIDLESASDSMSLKMLKASLPPSWYQWLIRLRSPSSRLPDGSVVPLNMVSTMGNGFTFPLQTAVFSAAAVAVHRWLLKHGKIDFRPIMFGDASRRNVAVFGDDIIVDKRVARYLIQFLEKLGFVVNRDKTFVEGPFRESCGVDVFLGTNVRPFYLRRLVTLQEAFVAINGLNLWSAEKRVPLRNTVQYILNCFPAVKRYPVPLDEDDSAGLHLPYQLLDKYRPKGGAVYNKWGLITYTKFAPIFFGYRIDVDSETFVGTRDPSVYNPVGLFIAYLSGSIRGYRVSRRQRETRYITKRKCTSRWDYLPPQNLSAVHTALRHTLVLQACEVNLVS